MTNDEGKGRTDGADKKHSSQVTGAARRRSFSTVVISIFILLGLAFTSCRKDEPPPAFLSIEGATEQTFDDGAMLWRFPLKGRSAESIKIDLRMITKGEIQHLASGTFDGLSEEFSGEITLLMQDGRVFGVNGKRVFSISASFDLVTFSAWSPHKPGTVEGLETFGGMMTTSGPINPGRTKVIMSRGFKLASSPLATGEFPDTIERSQEITKEHGHTLVVMTIYWKKR